MSVPKEILNAAESLPPLSPNALRLVQAVNDPEHSLSDITGIVQTDALLTGAVLRVVNSAAYGMQQEISSIDRAIGLLGDKAVVGIALNTCASHVFNAELEGYAGAVGELWQHSLRTAIAAREIAPHARKPLGPAVVYTAALLHDIGKSVLAQFLGGSLRSVVQDIDLDLTQDFLDGEAKALGTNHCEIGAIIAEKWALPPALTMAARWHHHPALCPEEYRHLLYVVHLGDMLAMMGGTGTGADTMAYELDENYPAYIDLDHRSLEGIFLSVSMEYDKTASAFQSHEGAS